MSSDLGKSIWSSLLSEVSSRSRDDFSGKTTLAAKLRGHEDPPRVSGLEYQFMEVEDEDNDEKADCGIWILEGDRAYRSLLKSALPKKGIQDTVLIITVDMSKPWNILDSIEKWTTIIREHLDQLKISPQEMREYENKIVDDFKKYVDPSEIADESSSIVSSALRLSTSENADDIAVPLGEDTLTCNIGMNVVVVCTKCDLAEKLETDHDYSDEHFDFIQHKLRTTCLKYGAALIYTSIKDNKNTEILHSYLLHKLYGFPFTTPASVVDKDTVFVPSGWDSEKKIGIISDNFVKLSAAQAYDSVIVRPPSRKTLQEKEIAAEDEQAFLARALSSMGNMPVASSSPRMSVPNRPALDMGRGKGTPVGRATVGGLATTTPAGKMKTEKPAAQSSERVLANFFNSLLNKKPSMTPQKGTPERSGDQARPQANSKSSPSKSTEAS